MATFLCGNTFQSSAEAWKSSLSKSNKSSGYPPEWQYGTEQPEHFGIEFALCVTTNLLKVSQERQKDISYRVLEPITHNADMSVLFFISKDNLIAFIF